MKLCIIKLTNNKKENISSIIDSEIITDDAFGDNNLNNFLLIKCIYFF